MPYLCRGCHVMRWRLQTPEEFRWEWFILKCVLMECISLICKAEAYVYLWAVMSGHELKCCVRLFHMMLAVGSQGLQDRVNVCIAMSAGVWRWKIRILNLSMKDEMFTHFEWPAALMLHASTNWNESWIKEP